MAGAGTGSRPWRVRTSPPPRGSVDTLQVQPASAAAMLPAATTSSSESQSPTSWKCTSSTGTRCIRLSACARRRRMATACAAVPVCSGAASMRAARSTKRVPCACWPVAAGGFRQAVLVICVMVACSWSWRWGCAGAAGLAPTSPKRRTASAPLRPSVSSGRPTPSGSTAARSSKTRWRRSGKASSKAATNMSPAAPPTASRCTWPRAGRAGVGVVTAAAPRHGQDGRTSSSGSLENHACRARRNRESRRFGGAHAGREWPVTTGNEATP